MICSKHLEDGYKTNIIVMRLVDLINEYFDFCLKFPVTYKGMKQTTITEYAKHRGMYVIGIPSWYPYQSIAEYKKAKRKDELNRWENILKSNNHLGNSEKLNEDVLANILPRLLETDRSKYRNNDY